MTIASSLLDAQNHPDVIKLRHQIKRDGINLTPVGLVRDSPATAGIRQAN